MKKLSQNWLFLAFLLPIPYWLYLLFSSSMLIDSDAKAYHNLGILLLDDGWKGYFTTGPQREPLYPLLIAVSMRLADILTVPYEKIQTVIQLGILFLTEILVAKFLKKLKVPAAAIFATVVYLGFSPAMVNSACSLFSEIITYPFILAIVWFATQSWKSLHAADTNRTSTNAISLGLSLVAMVFIKGIFELITPLFLLPFVYLTLRALIHKNKPLAARTAFCLLITALTFYIPIVAYKCVNKAYNGNYTLTNRGAWALYGNTVRKMEHLSNRHILAALAYAPGEGFCHSLFGKEECYFWSALNSDEYAKIMLKDLDDRGIKEPDVDQLLVAFTKAAIAKNPLQYLLLTGVEGSKIFFWESTRIGWVNYPDALQELFDCKPLNNSLRLLTALLAIAALLFIKIHLLKNWRQILNFEGVKNEDTVFLFFLYYLIFTYTLAHSLFFILTRYVFPVVPLYVIAIAYAGGRILSKKS